MDRIRRLQLFENVAQGLLTSYEEIRATGMEPGISGTSAEATLLAWMKKWLPQRIDARNGVAISATRGPTTQRDCLLFDQFESPVFHRAGTTDILPIEGIVGGVELNYGTATTYEKLQHDAEKLSELADLAHDRFPRHATLVSHLPTTADPMQVSNGDLIGGLQFHRSFDGKPLLLIFAEDSRGDLAECSSRLMEHNKRVGVARSVDGLFILKKGFALHLDARIAGWTTTRIGGLRFGCLAASPGAVLLRLQSIILKNLNVAGKTYPDGFDRYTAAVGQAQTEMEKAIVISDDLYTKQIDERAFSCP